MADIAIVWLDGGEKEMVVVKTADIVFTWLDRKHMIKMAAQRAEDSHATGQGI